MSNMQKKRRKPVIHDVDKIIKLYAIIVFSAVPLKFALLKTNTVSGINFVIF